MKWVLLITIFLSLALCNYGTEASDSPSSEFYSTLKKAEQGEAQAGTIGGNKRTPPETPLHANIEGSLWI